MRSGSAKGLSPTQQSKALVCGSSDRSVPSPSNSWDACLGRCRAEFWPPVAAPDFIVEKHDGVVIHVVDKCLQFVFGLAEDLGHLFDQLYGIHFFKKLAELVFLPQAPDG